MASRALSPVPVSWLPSPDAVSCLPLPAGAGPPGRASLSRSTLRLRPQSPGCQIRVLSPEAPATVVAASAVHGDVRTAAERALEQRLMYQVRLELSAAEKRTALQVETCLSAEREERRVAWDDVRSGMLEEFQKSIISTAVIDGEAANGEAQSAEQGRGKLLQTAMHTMAKVEEFHRAQLVNNLEVGQVTELRRALGTLESRTEALSARVNEVSSRYAALEKSHRPSGAEPGEGALAPYGRRCAESLGEAVERLEREASQSVARLEGIVESEREARNRAFKELEQLVLELRSVVQGLGPLAGRVAASPWRLSSSSPTGAPLQEALAKVSSLLGTLDPEEGCEGCEAEASPGSQQKKKGDPRGVPSLAMPAPQGIPRSIQPSQ